MVSLEGRVIVVTGGGGALGAAVVDRLLYGGASVVVPYVVAHEAPRLKAHVGAKVEGLHMLEADVGNGADAGRVASVAQAEYGQVDGLVHLVGGFWGGKAIVETPEDEWDRMLHMNLKTLFLCARAVLPLMQRQGFGRIVAIASRAGMQGTGGIAAYSIAKGAVAHFVQALAQETLADGICVNAVAPSTIDTPANRAAMPDADHSKWVAPAAIAEVIAFLCSPSASATSGAVIPVYGQA